MDKELEEILDKNFMAWWDIVKLIDEYHLIIRDLYYKVVALESQIDLPPEQRTTPWRKIDELEEQFSRILKHLHEWKYPDKSPKRRYKVYE